MFITYFGDCEMNKHIYYTTHVYSLFTSTVMFLIEGGVFHVLIIFINEYKIMTLYLIPVQQYV